MATTARIDLHSGKLLWSGWLKPSRGRISLGTGNSGGMLGNIVEFVLVRSVRDAAGILDAMAGSVSGSFVAAPPPRPYQVYDVDGAEATASWGCWSAIYSCRTRRSRLHRKKRSSAREDFWRAGDIMLNRVHPPALEGPTSLRPCTADDLQQRISEHA